MEVDRVRRITYRERVVGRIIDNVRRLSTPRASKEGTYTGRRPLRHWAGRKDR